MAPAPAVGKQREKPPGNIFDRVPPQSLDAEMAVLGSIMIDNDAFGKVIEILEPACFYRTAHRRIYAAALTLYERNEPIDLVTLSEELKRVKLLEEVGGTYYLTELTETVPSAANVEHHANIVFARFLLRKLIEESAAIARDCYEAEEDVYDILDRSEQRIFNLSERRLRNTYEPMSSIMHDTFNTIEKLHHGDPSVKGAPSGFYMLDELTSGFKAAELIVIAGRPSMGKTAFCLNIARNAAIDGGKSVGFFSLEMSKEQLAMRLLCAEARIDAHALRTGKLVDEDLQKLSMRAGILADAPIFIDDTPGISVLELRAKARRMRKEQGIGMIVIDYLQLMQGPGSAESRQQEISHISRSLKSLAKELDVPVLALSQLSRAVEIRGGDKRPMLSDLRESGAIEQDADVVIFIYRPEFYLKAEEVEAKGLEGKAEVIIGKQRSGPVGTIHLNFIKRYARFENPAMDDEL
ncbi:replicative DNA helicase [bacterium]|nr:replicative DNA helicase [bacterium]